jgi:glycosyltransferase involved in cell wall biosynthesis
LRLDNHPDLSWKDTTVRVCIVYDCLYPWTVGGAERWYRNLAERLSSAGHDITYLTRLQWPPGSEPEVPGVRVLPVSSSANLYTAGGRRRIWPPIGFGMGVFRHLARHGADYDVVHTASFPYFHLLAAAALRGRAGYRLFVDWHEVWTREYWRSYLGPVGGNAGLAVQRACLRVRQQAFCFSRLHEGRLRAGGVANVVRLEGQYADRAEAPDIGDDRSAVVFAGRHVAEKGVLALVPAFALVHERRAELRLEIYGDGPQRSDVLRQIERHRLDDTVTAPGFVDDEVLDRALRGAVCLVLPSRREGYGLVVVEAAANGVPTVVVAGPDNAAVELVEDGVNGAIAPSAEPGDLAAAIVRVHDLGAALRRSTMDWYDANERRLSLEASLDEILRVYADG